MGLESPRQTEGNKMTKLEMVSAPAPLKELYKSALLARENAYVPYSGFKVGAAIRTADGHVFSGCNVENSSYGGTNCAERVAIQKAVSERGPLSIVEIMIVTHADPAWPPCGMCRQVIAEFAGENPVIYTANLNGIYQKFLFESLFPYAFTPEHLK